MSGYVNSSGVGVDGQARCRSIAISHVHTFAFARYVKKKVPAIRKKAWEEMRRLGR